MNCSFCSHIPIPSQPYGFHNVSELQLCKALVLEVVPNDDVLGVVNGMRTSADQGQNVALEQHLHNAQAATKLIYHTK